MEWGAWPNMGPVWVVGATMSRSLFEVEPFACPQVETRWKAQTHKSRKQISDFCIRIDGATLSFLSCFVIINNYFFS